MSRATGRVGKKYAVYLPLSVVKAAGVKEGDKVEFEVTEGSVALKVVRDPLELALSGRKFASVSAQEIDEVSMSEQERHGNGTA